MGMFDYVRTEAPLPPEAAHLQEHHFQTKDFGNPRMGAYQIEADGRLMYLGYQIDAAPEDTKFHGMLNFYTWLSDEEKWWEFRAKFTDGRLVEIICTGKPETEPA